MDLPFCFIQISRENHFLSSHNCGNESSQIRVHEDNLTISYDGESENNMICALNPLKPTSSPAYYEVEVIAQGDEGFIEIGLSTCGNEINSSEDDGGFEKIHISENKFYRYSSQGKKNGSLNTLENSIYGSQFGAGDVVGCALNRRNEISFTLNGSSLGSGFKLPKEKREEDLYPCVSFSRKGWQARANFGKTPYSHNIQGLLQKITWSPIKKSKGIELSGANFIAKMRANRFSRQLSTEMVITGNLEAGLVSATNALKPSRTSPGYFEVTIIQECEPSLFHIALICASTDIKIYKETVFCAPSYWLASSGEKNANGVAWEDYTTRFGLNDVIGCGITPDRNIFYTLNGDNLGIAFQVATSEFEEGMIPAVRLGKGCGVQANFGRQPFLYDLHTLIK